MVEYIEFVLQNDEAAREQNRAALAFGVIGVKCAYVGRVNGPADAFCTGDSVVAAVPAGMVIRGAEVYETGAINAFVGKPGATAAAGFVRFRRD